MNDRELLELAAKAGGLNIDWDVHLDCGSHSLYRQEGTQEYWNPITDDGDALRLAVKLGLDFYEGDDEGRAAYVGYYPPTGNTRPQRFIVERRDAHQDQYAATRRAIVRAAAATLPAGGEA